MNTWGGKEEAEILALVELGHTFQCAGAQVWRNKPCTCGLEPAQPSAEKVENGHQKELF